MALFFLHINACAIVFGIGKTDAEEAAARKLEQTINDLELKFEGLSVHIDDDAATISGLAYDQSTREKAILVAGNSNGIATVDDRVTVEHVEQKHSFILL